MSDQIYDYDPAAALENEEAIAVFIADALETADAAYIATAMGVVARAKGMTELARETGLSREQLYRSFSEQAMVSNEMWAEWLSRTTRIIASGG